MRLPWSRPTVPVIELHGTIAAREGGLSLRSVGPAIDRAGRSARRSGLIVLDIDSPGGSPVQSDLIAAAIRRVAQKGVRVVAVIGEVGASGGYWIACAGDEIRASPMSVVGSIGVVGGGFGAPRLLARLGIERRLYTAGENKARLDPFSPERPEDVAFVQDLMTELHGRFIAWVRERRGARLLAADNAVFDGSWMLGSKARAAGLIDGFGDVDAVVRELAGPRAAIRRLRPRKRRRGLLGRLPGMLVAATLDEFEDRAARAFLPR